MNQVQFLGSYDKNDKAFKIYGIIAQDLVEHIDKKFD